MTVAVSSVLNFCIVLEQVSLLMVQPSCSSFYKAFFYVLIPCITGSVLVHVSLFYICLIFAAKIKMLSLVDCVATEDFFNFLCEMGILIILNYIVFGKKNDFL